MITPARGAWALAAAGALALAMVGPAAGTTRTEASRTQAPAPTADGRIAFDTGGNGVVEAVNPDGTALVQVTRPQRDGFAIQPGWTPDGSRLLYSASKNNSDFRLRVISPDGSSAGRLLARDKQGYGDFLPRVTPDGHRVLFTRCRPDPPGGCAVAEVRMNGTHLHQVVPFQNGVDVTSAQAVPSPDGRHLAYNEYSRNGIGVQVWVGRLDGSHAHPVTRPAREDAAWSWLPDGKTLLATDNWLHLGEGIDRIPAAGGAPVNLAQPPFWHQDYFPAASPSGHRMAFVSDVDFPTPNGAHLYVATIQGGGVHRLDVGADVVQAPTWGTAPLLPAASGTPSSRLAHPASPSQRRLAWSRIPGGVRHLIERK